MQLNKKDIPNLKRRQSSGFVCQRHNSFFDPLNHLVEHMQQAHVVYSSVWSRVNAVMNAKRGQVRIHGIS